MSPDTKNILKHVTLSRAWNYAKARMSFGISRITKRHVHWGMPVSISIEPTTACNLGCPECPSGLKKFSRPTGNLRLETNQRIIDELSRKLMYINFYFQGEPLIHSSFYELVKYAKSKKIYTATSTNAHFLDEENACALVKSGLDRLIISVDGITQKTYEAYRVHGKLDKVLQGIKNVVKAKSELKSKTPYIIYQMLVVRQNEHEVEDARKLAVELGCDEFRLKTAQVYEHEKGNQLIPVNEKYTRYRKNADGTYTLKNKLENHCWRMWQGCVFTWDGRVVPCCFDKDAVHQLGKVENGNGFNVIWRGNAYKNFRKKVLKSRAEVDICKNCSEGTEVFA